MDIEMINIHNEDCQFAQDCICNFVLKLTHWKSCNRSVMGFMFKFCVFILNTTQWFFWGNRFSLCEIFNAVGAFMRMLDQAQKKRKFCICNKIRQIHICCIVVVVHVMLPVIRLSVHDDDDDVKVKCTRWLVENYP